MKGLTEILKAHKEHGDTYSEEEYVKVVLLAFEYLAEEISSDQANKILVNKIFTLNIVPNKLMHYIYKRMEQRDFDYAERALTKLKNEDREIFGGFLSRNERGYTVRNEFIRRIRRLYEGTDSDEDSE